MNEKDDAWQAIADLLNNSPFYLYMNMRVVEAGGGKSKLVMETKNDMKNLYGTLHGGATATLLDSSCGIAIGTLLNEGEIVVTVDMRINYTASVSAGTLIGRGEVIHKGTKTGIASAEITDQEGNLVAAGMSTHLILPAGT